MMLHPNCKVRRASTQTGIGNKRTNISVNMSRLHFHDLFVNIRRLRWAPLEWSHARACKLPKATLKQNPCIKDRLMFVFDPVGNAFVATLVISEADHYPPQVHAYLRYRRRESAILCARAIPHKLTTQAKLHVFSCKHDKSNAFLSVDKNFAANRCKLLVDTDCEQIVEHHIKLAFLFVFVLRGTCNRRQSYLCTADSQEEI